MRGSSLTAKEADVGVGLAALEERGEEEVGVGSQGGALVEQQV